MFKNVLFRALLAVAAVSVVAIVPTEASAQERKRPSGDKAAAAKSKAKADAKEKAKEKAKAKAKAKVKAKAEVKAEQAAKRIEKREEAAAVALANSEATDAAKKSAEEAHAKKLGKIERLEQIATATNNEALKTQTSKLKELEDKRHKLAMAKFEAAAAEGGEAAK